MARLLAGLLLLVGACRQNPGPRCQNFIQEFEAFCRSSNANASLCRDEFQRQVEQLKRQGTTAGAEDICEENARQFAELREAKEKFPSLGDSR